MKIKTLDFYHGEAYADLIEAMAYRHAVRITKQDRCPKKTGRTLRLWMRAAAVRAVRRVKSAKSGWPKPQVS